MRKQWLIAPAIVAILALVVPPTIPAGAKTNPLILHAGEAVFWDGPYIESSSSGTSRWEYALKVVDRGYRLRIGIDHPEVGDVFNVTVTSPGGSSTSFSPGTGLYSSESRHVHPATGTWRVRVTAQDVTESAFRMRAKLEASPPSVGKGRDLVLPNLQVLPPHAASFLTPVTNGSTGGAPQGVDLLGAEACHPEEHVEDLAVRCLRFSFGIRNTGLGPMQLFYDGGPPQDQTLYQRVLRADGTHFDREAGIARWHKTHVHYHHHNAVGLRLFRVIDTEKGTLEPAGALRYKGFAHRDELLREWTHFYPTWDRFGFGLAAGWSDIYEWDRPGNYIDFGVNGDGHYVIRMWADPTEGVVESNEVDNAGYTYFKVTGSEVKLLEAGRGRDPWDRCKILMPFGGYPEPQQSPRPKDCPPDST